jgi:hypothetical protein
MTVTRPPASPAAPAVARWYPGRTADATAEAVANMAALADLAEAEADGAEVATGIEPAADAGAGTEVGEERGA